MRCMRAPVGWLCLCGLQLNVHTYVYVMNIQGGAVIMRSIFSKITQKTPHCSPVIWGVPCGSNSQSLQWCMQYHVILHRVITAADCTSFESLYLCVCPVSISRCRYTRTGISILLIRPLHGRLIFIVEIPFNSNTVLYRNRDLTHQCIVCWLLCWILSQCHNFFISRYVRIMIHKPRHHSMLWRHWYFYFRTITILIFFKQCKLSIRQR